MMAGVFALTSFGEVELGSFVVVCIVISGQPQNIKGLAPEFSSEPEALKWLPKGLERERA
jgi:hypothetical protein